MPLPQSGTDVPIYRMLNPVARGLCNTVITPNVISVLGILMTIPALFALHGKRAGWFLIIVVIRQLLDCLDGTVARECNAQSKLGNLLDSTGDLLFTTTLVLYTCVIVALSSRFALPLQIVLIGGLVVCTYMQYRSVLHLHHGGNDAAGGDKHQTHSDFQTIVHDNSVVAAVVAAAVLLVIKLLAS